MQETTRQRFDRQVGELDGTPVYREWLGVNKPHQVICKEGHECFPLPRNVQQGNGMCRKCAGKDPEQAEQYFRKRVAELGGTPVYLQWQGVHKGHAVICKAGHECFPRPGDVQQGKGICRKCAGTDPEQAEQDFRKRIAELGGTPVYREWLGVLKPHQVICKAGHECFPRPGDVQQGKGICRKCAGQEWDIFYVVSKPGEVKFGITSLDHRRRIATHRAAGFTIVNYLLTDYPEARQLEDKIKGCLRECGFEPVRGTEYFREEALPFIMSVLPSATQPASSAGTGPGQTCS